MSKNRGTRERIEQSDESVTLHFKASLPHQIPRGHKPHRSGAGVHGQRKKVRIRGNQAKRQWLDNE